MFGEVSVKYGSEDPVLSLDRDFPLLLHDPSGTRDLPLHTLLFGCQGLSRVTPSQGPTRTPAGSGRRRPKRSGRACVPRLPGVRKKRGVGSEERFPFLSCPLRKRSHEGPTCSPLSLIPKWGGGGGDVKDPSRVPGSGATTTGMQRLPHTGHSSPQLQRATPAGQRKPPSTQPLLSPDGPHRPRVGLATFRPCRPLTPYLSCRSGHDGTANKVGCGGKMSTLVTPHLFPSLNGPRGWGMRCRGVQGYLVDDPSWRVSET